MHRSKRRAPVAVIYLITSRRHGLRPRFRLTKCYGKSSRSSAETSSLRLDVGGPDHLAPLFGFVGDEFAEVRGRTWQRGAPQFGKPRLHLGVREGGVDLPVEF